MVVPVSRQCDDADAFASYDDGSAAAKSGRGLSLGATKVGPFSGVHKERTVHTRLDGLPAALVNSNNQTSVTLTKIPNMWQLPVPHPLPMGTVIHNVTPSDIMPAGFDLDLQLPVGTHDVWTVKVLRPPKCFELYKRE
jgi:hypothetical protein